MRERARKGAVAAFLIVFLVAAGFYLYTRDPERRLLWMPNDIAHCPNCSSFFRNALHEYADDHDGWFPKGGTSALDSLTQLLEYNSLVHVYTCHAFAAGLRTHYQETGSFSEEFCCYRYNEGLRADDPEDLIVVYYFRPTRWTCYSSKGRVLGRQVLSTSRWGWHFVPEAEFQERQRRTLAFLEERKRRATDIDTVTSNLVLSVVCTNAGPGSFRFSANLRNRSATDPATLLLLAPGQLIHREDGSHGSYFLEEEGRRLYLMPAGEHSFPGWLEVMVEDDIRDGNLIGRSTRLRAFSGRKERDGTPIMHTSQGRTRFGPGVDASGLNAGYRVQASLRVKATMGSVTDLDVVLSSGVFKYLELHANTVEDSGGSAESR